VWRVGGKSLAVASVHHWAELSTSSTGLITVNIIIIIIIIAAIVTIIIETVIAPIIIHHQERRGHFCEHFLGTFFHLPACMLACSSTERAVWLLIRGQHRAPVGQFRSLFSIRLGRCVAKYP